MYQRIQWAMEQDMEQDMEKDTEQDTEQDMEQDMEQHLMLQATRQLSQYHIQNIMKFQFPNQMLNHITIVRPMFSMLSTILRTSEL